MKQITKEELRLKYLKMAQLADGKSAKYERLAEEYRMTARMLTGGR